MKENLVQKLGLGLALTVGVAGYGGCSRDYSAKDEGSYSVVEMSDLEREIEGVRGGSWEKIIVEAIYEKPEEAKNYIFGHFKGSEKRFEEYDFDKMSKEDISKIQTAYDNPAFSVDLPDDPSKLSESDKIAIFFVDEIIYGIASAIFPGSNK